MLANSITLATASFGDDADKVYTRFAEQANRSDYIGVGHTPSVRNQMQVYRTFPKRNGDVLGSRKCAVKVTVDTEVENASGTGNIMLPLIAELSMSIPEGTTSAQVVAILQKVLAAGLHDEFKTKTMITLEI